MLRAIAGGLAAACVAGWIWGLLGGGPSDGPVALSVLVGGAHALVGAIVGAVALGGYLAMERLGLWSLATRWLSQTPVFRLAAILGSVGLGLGAAAAGAIYWLGWEVRALPWATAAILAGIGLVTVGTSWKLRQKPVPSWGLALAAVVVAVSALGFGVGWTADIRGPAAVGVLERGGVGGRVVRAARASHDRDADGYPLAFCDEDCDCDDNAAAVNPGADEIADNGVDEDCDGTDLTASDLAALIGGGGALGAGAQAGVGTVDLQADPEKSAPPAKVMDEASGASGVEKPQPVAKVPSKPPWQRRYNVLLIVMDTVRADHLGFMGYERQTSPRMDELAKRSIVFTQARVQGSMTRESLPTIFTGRYFEELHRRDQEWPKIHDDNLMLAERFKDAGYSTFGITSFIYVVPHFGFAQGFETYETRILKERAKVHWNRTSDLVTDYTLAAVDRMRTEKPDAPWFVFAHYADPHAGYLRHPESPRFGGFTADIYDEEIFFTDLHIGRLLDELQKRDLTKDTVVIITSDHGEGLRRDEDHGGIYHGQHLYDTLVHVPLVFTVPGLKPRRDAEPVGAVDIVPTLIDLIGLPKGVGEPLSGRSLMPQLAGITPRPKRGPVFMTKFRPSTRSKVAMVDWPYKVVWNIPINRWELYDLATDVGEKRNLAKKAAHADRMVKYQRTVKTWRSHVLKRRPSREADEPPQNPAD